MKNTLLLLPIGVAIAIIIVAFIGPLFLAKPARGDGFLVVKNFPNPTNIHTVSVIPKRRFPYMWFYRTEVINTSKKPLKIVRFESYFWMNNRWVAANILRRPLTTEVFVRWYRQEDGKQDGWLRPGKRAVCDINWHGFNVPYAPKAKWVFYAVDHQGKKYQAEGEITSVPYNAKQGK